MGEQYYLNIMLELEADASTTEMPKIVNESDNGGRTNALRRSKYPRSGTCYGLEDWNIFHDRGMITKGLIISLVQ